jgi:hypothetical protein
MLLRPAVVARSDRVRSPVLLKTTLLTANSSADCGRDLSHQYSWIRIRPATAAVHHISDIAAVTRALVTIRGAC